MISPFSVLHSWACWRWLSRVIYCEMLRWMHEGNTWEGQDLIMSPNYDQKATDRIISVCVLFLYNSNIINLYYIVWLFLGCLCWAWKCDFWIMKLKWRISAFCYTLEENLCLWIVCSVRQSLTVMNKFLSQTIIQKCELMLFSCHWYESRAIHSSPVLNLWKINL